MDFHLKKLVKSNNSSGVLTHVVIKKRRRRSGAQQRRRRKIQFEAKKAPADVTAATVPPVPPTACRAEGVLGAAGEVAHQDVAAATPC